MSNATNIEKSVVGATSGVRAVRLGKYRIMAKLGTGGMADVYLAVAEGAMNVNRLVVVKRLRDEQASDPSAREMFLNEARLAARLNHANVIQTFEAGSEAGGFYLAMEYVEGQPLSRVLTKLRAEGRRLEPKMAARVCADALGGLHYAHELTDFDGTPLGIVHRDVSPQNIMLTYAGVTKIVDFGIAKAAGTSQTAHGVFKGKVAYMAPEQVVGENVDGRADVFAAAIVLWEALTGKHLMASDTPAKTLYNLMNKPIPRASTVVPDVPAALDDILAKALERDLDARYASAKAMRDALEAYIAAAGGVTSEAVGELVSKLFEDRKRTVQQQVKAQLATLSFGRSSDPKIRVEQSATHVRPPAETIIDLSEGATPGSQAAMYRVVTTGAGYVPEGMAPAPASRTRKVVFVVWVSVTAAALLVNAFALYRSQRASATPAPSATPVAVTVAETATSPAPAKDPENATVPSPSVASVAPVHATAEAPAARPAAVRWSAPAAAAPAAPKATATAAAPPAEAHSAATTAPAPALPPAKPAETATGRTFRRSL